MKKLLFLVSFLLIIGVILYFFVFHKSTKLKYENLEYNQVTGRWEESATPPQVVLDGASQVTNSDEFSNQTVQRGYFDSYDSAKKQLQIKALIPFTYGRKYKLTTIALPENQVIYCAPTNLTDSQTGKIYQVENITFPVKENELLSIPNEKTIDFADLLAKANQNTYLFIQLGQNSIQKLIVLGLCD